MGYTVEVLDEVKEIDMPKLIAVDQRLARVAAEIVRDLHSDPWLGHEMRERLRLEVLKACPKVPFDVPGRRGKPRFRLVYRNDPSDGSIAVVTILAVGHRSELEAYKSAATRLGRRESSPRRHRP